MKLIIIILTLINKVRFMKLNNRILSLRLDYHNGCTLLDYLWWAASNLLNEDVPHITWGEYVRTVKRFTLENDCPNQTINDVLKAWIRDIFVSEKQAQEYEDAEFQSRAEANDEEVAWSRDCEAVKYE